MNIFTTLILCGVFFLHFIERLLSKPTFQKMFICSNEKKKGFRQETTNFVTCT